MRFSMSRTVLAPITLLALLGIASPGWANPLDLSLGRFLECSNTNWATCIPHTADYERFLAEYAYGIGPKILAPAETLGYSGFYLGLETTITPVPGTSDRWLRGTVWSEPVDDDTVRYESDSVMFMPGLHVRKGLPWSIELGASINYLARSELVGLGFDVKWSLLEGYRHGFREVLPDVAVRGSVVRVLGQSDVDLTVVGVDASISYNFGVGGMLQLVPYGGFQYLMTFARLEPLAFRDDTNGTLYPQAETGLSDPDLFRKKVFLGLKLQYEKLSLTADVGWGLPEKWQTGNDVPQFDGDGNPLRDDQGDRIYEKEDVEVTHQIQVGVGVGLDF